MRTKMGGKIVIIAISLQPQPQLQTRKEAHVEINRKEKRFILEQHKNELVVKQKRCEIFHRTASQFTFFLDKRIRETETLKFCGEFSKILFLLQTQRTLRINLCAA